MMKFSSKTLGILRNFDTINQSMVFEKGRIIRSMSPHKSILAFANIDEEIEQDAVVYDMGRFLTVLSMYQDPEIEFEDKMFKITEGKKKAHYAYADASMVEAPKKSAKFGEADVEVELSSANLTAVLKACGAMQLPDVAFIGEGGKCYIRAMDSDSPTSDGFDIEIGDAAEDFIIVMKADNLKLINTDYNARFSIPRIAEFKSTDGTLTYYIAVTANKSKKG